VTSPVQGVKEMPTDKTGSTSQQYAHLCGTGSDISFLV
jgi:hypothetical protein